MQRQVTRVIMQLQLKTARGSSWACGERVWVSGLSAANIKDPHFSFNEDSCHDDIIVAQKCIRHEIHCISNFTLFRFSDVHSFGLPAKALLICGMLPALQVGLCVRCRLAQLSKDLPCSILVVAALPIACLCHDDAVSKNFWQLGQQRASTIKLIHSTFRCFCLQCHHDMHKARINSFRETMRDTDIFHEGTHTRNECAVSITILDIHIDVDGIVFVKSNSQLPTPCHVSFSQELVVDERTSCLGGFTDGLAAAVAERCPHLKRLEVLIIVFVTAFRIVPA